MLVNEYREIVESQMYKSKFWYCQHYVYEQIEFPQMAINKTAILLIIVYAIANKLKYFFDTEKK